MASEGVFAPHLRLFSAVRRRLLRKGFDYETVSGFAREVPEIPRPAFMYVGQFEEFDLSVQSAHFPHLLSMEPVDAYVTMLAYLRRERASNRGRPLTRFWEEFAPTQRTGVGAIFTPMRSGYYGLPRNVVGIGYHAAEFAWLIHRLDPESEVVFEPGSFYVESDSRLYGVINNHLNDPEQGFVKLDHPFDPELLFYPRVAEGATLTWMRPMWRAIQEFVLGTDLREDDGFMQALSHCRWALPATVQWSDKAFTRRPRGRPRLRSRARPEELALRVEECRAKLEMVPNLEIRHIRNRLVPAVLSPETWRSDLGPLVRHKKLRRGEVIEYLKNLEESILSR